MTIVSHLAVPAIAASLLLAGCGGSTGTTATQPSTVAATSAAPTPAAASPSAASNLGPVKPPGSKVFVDNANGYQVAVPSGYVRITSKAQLAKIVKVGASRVGISRQLVNKSLKMIAVKPATSESINVVVNSADGLTADQLPEAVPALKKQVAKLGARSITFKKATLGGEPALRGAYTITQNGRHVLTVQYITVHGDSAYTLTFSQFVRLASKIEKQTAGSVRFL